jgi:hypothetical protein
MKYEMKIEFKDDEQLKNVIDQSYFHDGNNGKLIGKKSYVSINEENPLFIAFRGLNNATIKLINEKLIEGSLRCVVDESQNSINLYPINNYCIIENQKYSFY